MARIDAPERPGPLTWVVWRIARRQPGGTHTAVEERR
jgi:hypothetical protein